MNEMIDKHYAFFPNTISFGCNEYGLEDYVLWDINFKYRIGKYKLNEMEIEVDKEVERLSKMMFLPDMPREAKIYLAHNYLAFNVKYLLNHDNNLDASYCQSAYGAFIEKKCVCQGYAEAFKRLMDHEKIECIAIWGAVVKSDGLHGWNLVSLGNGGNYYHIDVTWDSGLPEAPYTYFCKNDAFFKYERVWDNKLFPACNGSYPILAVAKRYVSANKARLLANGVSKKVLDCD